MTSKTKAATTTDLSPSAGMTYADSGVDIEAGDRMVGLIEHHMRRTYGPRVLGKHGAFAGLLRLDYNERLFKRNYRDPLLVACTDGVGSKVKLAIDMGVFDTIGQDCVAMNVNDLIVQGAEPLLFLDYIGTHKLDPEHMAQIVKGVADGCELAGCALLGGETAELPDLYAKGDFDLAGFAVGVCELHRVIDGSAASPDDVLLGLASSGVHSNGYSLVRAIIKQAGLNLNETYAGLADHEDHKPGLSESSSEGPDRASSPFKSGPSSLVPRSSEPGLGRTLGQTLLTPTRIYARSVVSVLRAYKVKQVITAMAHITGGGMPGNIPRVLGSHLNAKINRSAWRVPPVFNFLQEHGRVDDAEMFRVFNMGIGYVLAVRPYFADAVADKLTRQGERVAVLGKLTRGTGRVVLS